MQYLNQQAVHEALQELSDRDLQRRLWLSDGSGRSEVSSFVEAVEKLFSDSGLDDALQAGETGLGIEVDTALGELHIALRKVEVSHGPTRQIDDSAMSKVRSLASRILSILTTDRSDPLLLMRKRN